MPFPLIVKPSREDASVGITRESVVWTRETLEQRVAHVLSHYRQPALVERYIDGREIYVSMLGRTGGRPQIFPFYEIDFSEMPADRPRIVSFEGKWVEDSDEYRGTKPVRCTDLTPELSERASRTPRWRRSRRWSCATTRGSTSGSAADGSPYVIDVNPNCDLSDVAGGFSEGGQGGGAQLRAGDPAHRRAGARAASRTPIPSRSAPARAPRGAATGRDGPSRPAARSSAAPEPCALGLAAV